LKISRTPIVQNKYIKQRGKSPQRETTPQGENPFPIKGTSKTKTPEEKLLYATLL